MVKFRVEMSLNSILSGLIATYLVVSPCMAINHDASVSGADQIASHQVDDHGHNHGHNESESGDDEHCCDDLSASIHAPIKQIPVGALVAIVPSLEIIIPYVHLEQHTALSRDGPLFEHAREFASTIVVRV